MKDETYVFIQDVKEKGSTARSARNRRTHNGKGGRVKFPSDNLSRKELQAMNGEVKSYRLNEPMKWEEFKALPDDIKVTYIKLLRKRFNCFDSAIAEMMGIGKCTFSNEVKRLGLGHGTKHGGYRKWDEKEVFWSWVHGVPISKTAEETTETDEQPEEEQHSCEPDPVPDFDAGIPVPEFTPLPDCKENAIPASGNMTFVGSAEAALNAVGVLLGGADVHITITWEVCD